MQHCKAKLILTLQRIITLFRNLLKLGIIIEIGGMLQRSTVESQGMVKRLLDP